MGNQCNQPICCVNQNDLKSSVEIEWKKKEMDSQKQPQTRPSSHQQGTDAEQINGKSLSLSHSSLSLSLEQSQHNDVDILSPKPSEIFLQIDDRWMHNMKVSKTFPIDIFDVYQQVINQRVNQDRIQKRKFNYLTLRRVAQQNRKIQILFKQHIPRHGKYYFEIDLLEYRPKYKCLFTIGVANYFKAKSQLHSRDKEYQQSYTYSQRSQDRLVEQNKNGVVKLDKKIVVEVSREKENPYIAFYINGDMVGKEEQLKKELLDPRVALVPYIQTQYEGISFSWKQPIKVEMTQFAMATILEEGSSSSPIKIRRKK